jgi:hypothetical protein
MKIMKLAEAEMKLSPLYFLGSPEDIEGNNTKTANHEPMELRRGPKTPK